MKIVIVGGVAGGASAAARARRLSETAEIVLIERSPDPSFANCGMPYYIGGEIASRDKLLVTPVERLRVRYRLDVRASSVVESIDRQTRTVHVRDLNSGHIYVEPYDRLILSPGATPMRPTLAGFDLPNIFTLRDLRDTDQIKNAVDAGAKRALVVGAGFIGLEMAENLVRRGLDTTVVEFADQILPPWDREITTDVAAHLRDRGVHLHLGQSITEFRAEEQ
jgi:NADPH-dependent 2,4-dienoyl-CoA reductase/sulfur reductase-like enzyme